MSAAANAVFTSYAWKTRRGYNVTSAKRLRIHRFIPNAPLV